MKKHTLLLVLFCLSLVVNAQPPQLIPYQAIARDNSGNPVLNQNIGLRFSIRDQTISGTVVWQESQTVVSNNLGIIVTALGGTTQLTSVDWGSGAKFLQVEMDIAGGTNYLDMGTQQMMSVPYALYAETSGSVINNGGGGNGSFTHWIGELYGGGIVCHLWKDTQGVEHGLIASCVDLNPSCGDVCPSNICGSPWGPEEPVFLNCLNRINGAINSNVIIQNNPQQNSAAVLCDNYENDGFGDWYLPAVYELEFLSQNRFIINSVLSENVNFDNVGLHESCENWLATYYVSSTEYSDTHVWVLGTEPAGIPFTLGWAAKYANYSVRAFRKF